MDEQPISILLIPGNGAEARQIEAQLAEQGGERHRVQVATGGPNGLERVRAGGIDMALVDVAALESCGIDAVSQLRRAAADLPIVALTGVANAPSARRALEAGAQDCVCREAATGETLWRAIRYARERCRLEAHVRRLEADAARLNRQVEQKNRRLAELYDTAHQFMDNVSYEFRTPLAVVKEFTSILRDGLAGAVNDEQRQYLDIVADRVEDLTLMIADMLDLSRLEAGLLSVVRRGARLEDIVRQVQPVLERRAAAQQVQYAVALDADLPEVYCDSQKIERIIVNLVLHALRNARPGEPVRLEARNEPESGQVRVEIRFEAAPSAGDVRADGRELSQRLEVARQLVRLNFGELTIEHEPDSAAALHFTLPLAQPDHLIARYVRHCERQCAAQTSLALVTASPAVPLTAAAAEQTDDFLHHLLRRHDLVLRSENGCWLLAVCGAPPDLEKVLARIDKAWAEAQFNPAGPALQRLHLEVKGAWPVRGGAAEFIAYFLEELRAADPVPA